MASSLRIATCSTLPVLVDGRRGTRQQFRQARLALDQRQRPDILAVEMQKIENEIHQPGRVAGIRGGLDHADEVMPSGKTPHNSPSR
jgi:hypothetical protein